MDVNNGSSSGLKRRKSIPNGNHRNNESSSSSPAPSFSGADFDLVPLKVPAASYTSLKDMLPWSPSSSIPSPIAAATAAVSSGSGYEISIRNRLVKQAALAYLQPAVSSSPSSSGRCLFFSGDYYWPLVSRFRRFFVDTVTRVYDWLVDALWLTLCR